MLFDNCTFRYTQGTGPRGDIGGVLLLNTWFGPISRLTFLNCTISNCIMPGGGGSGSGVNGCKVIGNVDDLSFVGTSFGTPGSPAGAFNRISYEAVDGETQRTAFIGCSFEPVSGEAISTNGSTLYELVDGCTFKGLGLNLPNSSWNASGFFEANWGSYAEVRNSEFWQGYGPWTNFSNQPISPPMFLFKNCIFDMTHYYQTPHTGYAYGGFGNAISGVDLIDCYVNTGSAAEHLRYFTAVPWQNCNLTGTNLTGYTDNGGPTSLANYLGGLTVKVNPTLAPYTAYPHAGDPNYP